jgi:heparosan-N-sulfate-glucuronate 5-epimerase
VRCLLGLALGLAISTPALADTGPYLDFGQRPRMADSPAIVIEDGVAKVDYRHTATPSLGLQDNPVTAAQVALQEWSYDNRQPVLDTADWLLARQREDGAWTYSFAFNALGVPMTPPWISALAQGQAISVLVRAHAQIGDQRYLDAAELALRPLTKPVSDGGVATDWDGFTWFEEYPGPDSQHVLNGFQFTLIGLHDFADCSPLAQHLWEQGVRSLAAKIGVYDYPAGRTQFYAALGGGRIPVNGTGYGHEHAVLTRELADLAGLQVLEDYAARWEAYERPAAAPPVAPPLPARTAPPAAVPPPASPAAPVLPRLAPRKVVVPRLKGLTVRAARRRLACVGLRLGRVRQLGGRGGRVVRQRPGTGRRVQVGARVTVAVRRTRRG